MDQSKPPTELTLFARIGEVQDRQANARILAAYLGAQELLLFVFDPAVGALLPARGMPATMDGGPLWRQFLIRCRGSGRHEALVDCPRGSSRKAIAIVGFELAVVLVGGEPHEQKLTMLHQLLPLLASAVVSQQQIDSIKTDAREARAAASRAHSLTQALDSARAAGEHLNVELRDKDQRKDEFLAMLAHELRNPLSVIASSVAMLKHNAIQTDPLRQSRSLDVMTRQLQHLTRLVEDLLDVSRVSKGKIELRLSQFDLRGMLGEVLEENRPALDARQLQLDAALGDERLPVMADRVRLAQVFGNLLHNAGKYSDPGGHVKVRAWHDGSRALVTIQDTGVGLPPEMQDKIFDLFTQVRVGLDRSKGGLGIGLTLVRSLVQLHFGEVRAQSDGIGQGTTFTVALPLATTVDAAIAVPEKLAAQRVARVLVVDDNTEAADALAEWLKLLGHHVDVAYLGQTALQMVPRCRPDIVFLDIGLPDLNGYEVARRLRKAHGHAFHLVALTGYGAQEDRKNTGDAGFDLHLVKPTELGDIESAIAQSRQNTA